MLIRKLLLSIFILGTIEMSAQNKQHTVSKGDTFESIAHTYGISVDELKKANTRIKNCVVGFKLTIPQKSPSSNAVTDAVINKASAQSKETATIQSNSSQQNSQERSDVSHISISPSSYPPEAVKEYEYWKKNYGKEASKALVRSAHAGYPEAMKEYAHELQYGHTKGIKKDKKESAIWYLKAARAGNSDAMWHISIYGDDKEFGSLSRSQKEEWLHKAMEYGNASATSHVASNYIEGRFGYPLDLSKAAGLYDKACQLGRIYVKYNEFRKCAKYLAGSTAQAIEKARKYEAEGNEQRAALWYFKAAEEGNSYAMLKIGDACEKQLFSECYDKPFEWYKKSAEAGNAEGMYKLAQLFNTGTHGVSRDKGMALDWFKKSYQAGNNDAISKIAESYRYGYGVTRNLEEAKKWYALAEKKNIDGASGNLREVNRSIQLEAEKKARRQQTAAVSSKPSSNSTKSASNNGVSSSNDDWNTKMNKVSNSLNNLSESLINLSNSLQGRGNNRSIGTSTDSNSFESNQNFKNEPMYEEISEDMSERKKEEIRAKNKELFKKFYQDQYNNAMKWMRNNYDTYATFHKGDVNSLVKEYKKEGKFSMMMMEEAGRKFWEYMKYFRENKRLAGYVYRYAEKRGHKLIKHKDHDLEFDFKNPKEVAKSQLEREGIWHGW